MLPDRVRSGVFDGCFGGTRRGPCVGEKPWPIGRLSSGVLRAVRVQLNDALERFDVDGVLLWVVEGLQFLFLLVLVLLVIGLPTHWGFLGRLCSTVAIGRWV